MVGRDWPDPDYDEAPTTLRAAFYCDIKEVAQSLKNTALLLFQGDKTTDIKANPSVNRDDGP